MYEGVPMRPDAGIWWKIVQDWKVTSMFSSPTAVRVLKKQDPAFMREYDITSLKYLFLAGEPLDEPTARWVAEHLGVAIVDNYWQTETGWPILTACPGVEDTPRKFGSPSFPAYGYRVKLKHEETGKEVGANEKGVLCIVPPLPPGGMTTIWGDDERYVQTYYTSFKDEMVYTTFDWATRDEDGYYFVLGRTDDVINVAGHRLGTREIEEAVAGASQRRRGGGGRRGRRAQGPGADGVRGGEGRLEGRDARARRGAREGNHGHRGPGDRRDRAPGARVLRDGAAQDALRQAAAPLDPGDLRGSRSRATSPRSRIRARWSRSVPRSLVPDLLAPGLVLVFCGTALRASARPALLRQPGNMLARLHAAESRRALLPGEYANCSAGHRPERPVQGALRQRGSGRRSAAARLQVPGATVSLSTGRACWHSPARRRRRLLLGRPATPGWQSGLGPHLVRPGLHLALGASRRAAGRSSPGRRGPRGQARAHFFGAGPQVAAGHRVVHVHQLAALVHAHLLLHREGVVAEGHRHVDDHLGILHAFHAQLAVLPDTSCS